MSVDYPDDADGAVLRNLAADGNDMSRPMSIDFQIAAPDADVAQAVATEAQKLGFEVSVYMNDDPDESGFEDDPLGAELEGFDEDDSPFTCECSRVMIPTYDGIMAAQAELESLANSTGAVLDGWGTFGNVEGAEPS
jgi:regulator of RNase E activity RraB